MRGWSVRIWGSINPSTADVQYRWPVAHRPSFSRQEVVPILHQTSVWFFTYLLLYCLRIQESLIFSCSDSFSFYVSVFYIVMGLLLILSFVTCQYHTLISFRGLFSLRAFTTLLPDVRLFCFWVLDQIYILFWIFFLVEVIGNPLCNGIVIAQILWSSGIFMFYFVSSRGATYLYYSAVFSTSWRH